MYFAQEFNDFYQTLFDEASHPIWIFDPNNLCFLQANAAASRYYGYSRTEFMRMSIIDIRPSEEIPAVLNNVQHTQFQNMEEIVRENRLHKIRRGDIVDVELQAQSVIYQGKLARLVQILRITDYHTKSVLFPSSSPKESHFPAINYPSLPQQKPQNSTEKTPQEIASLFITCNCRELVEPTLKEFSYIAAQLQSRFDYVLPQRSFVIRTHVQLARNLLKLLLYNAFAGAQNESRITADINPAKSTFFPASPSSAVTHCLQIIIHGAKASISVEEAQFVLQTAQQSSNSIVELEEMPLRSIERGAAQGINAALSLNLYTAGKIALLLGGKLSVQAFAPESPDSPLLYIAEIPV